MGAGSASWLCQIGPWSGWPSWHLGDGAVKGPGGPLLPPALPVRPTSQVLEIF